MGKLADNVVPFIQPTWVHPKCLSLPPSALRLRPCRPLPQHVVSSQRMLPTRLLHSILFLPALETRGVRLRLTD